MRLHGWPVLALVVDILDRLETVRSRLASGDDNLRPQPGCRGQPQDGVVESRCEEQPDRRPSRQMKSRYQREDGVIGRIGEVELARGRSSEEGTFMQGLSG